MELGQKTLNKLQQIYHDAVARLQNNYVPIPVQKLLFKPGSAELEKALEEFQSKAPVSCVCFPLVTCLIGEGQSKQCWVLRGFSASAASDHTQTTCSEFLGAQKRSKAQSGATAPKVPVAAAWQG